MMIWHRLHYETIIPRSLVNTHHLNRWKIKRNTKNYFLVMRNRKIYPQQFSHIMLIYNSVNYIYHVVHHISSSHSSCNWEFMLLTAFIQFPLPHNPLPLVTTNFISFPEFVCFQYIIDLQQCISSLVHYQHSDWVFLYISKWPPW